MKQKENSSIYTADEGKLIVRKADDFIMGPSIDLGSADSIENYDDREFSEEEIKNFYESVGIEHKVKKAHEEVEEHNNDTEEVKDEDKA